MANRAIKCRILDNAIENVKQGGVSDDVCEWEKGSSGIVLFRKNGGLNYE